MGRKRSAFPDTDWSLLRRAGSAGDDVRRLATSAILSAYYPIMIGHVMRRFRLPRPVAEDLVHQFIADKILVKNVLAKADRGLGRFRGYLVRVLDNFAISELRRLGRRQKGRIDVAAIDDLPDEAADSEAGFDREWAAQILNDALESMAAECTTTARTDIWRIFKFRIVDPILRDAVPMPYDALVRELSLRDPRQAINLLASAKRVFERHVRGRIAAFAAAPGDLDREYADFCQIILKRGE